MNLISLIVGLIILGVILYLINLIPMDATVKKVIWVLAILCIILWVLQSFGIISNFGPAGTVRIG